MSKVEEILQKYADEAHDCMVYDKGVKQDLFDGQVSTILAFAKEIAEISFYDGSKYGIDFANGSPLKLPTKEQFINQLFNDTP
jgi:hypothetical protein